MFHVVKGLCRNAEALSSNSFVCVWVFHFFSFLFSFKDGVYCLATLEIYELADGMPSTFHSVNIVIWIIKASRQQITLSKISIQAPTECTFPVPLLQTVQRRYSLVNLSNCLWCQQEWLLWNLIWYFHKNESTFLSTGMITFPISTDLCFKAVYRLVDIFHIQVGKTTTR